jgi:FKBP-type peptidyl-prolyl cis-trans isomerase
LNGIQEAASSILASSTMNTKGLTKKVNPSFFSVLPHSYPSPPKNEADTIECYYRATVINGTEIDSSSRIGLRETFTVAGLITGWSEALKLMPVGSKWRLFVPPELAYGEHGAGRDIGPDGALIFELELIAIK